MNTILADESVDFPIITLLRNSGFKVYSIIENNQGINDLEVLEFAKQIDCILLTGDKDFGEIAFRQNNYCKGIILYRLHGIENIEKAKIVCEVIQKYKNQLIDKFIVITKQRIRIVDIHK